MKMTGTGQRHVMGTQRDGSKDGISQRAVVVATFVKRREDCGLEERNLTSPRRIIGSEKTAQQQLTHGTPQLRI